MPTITWSQSFVTGDERVDAQHKELFRMINAFHDAIAQQRAADVLERIISALERYVGEHFAMEAQLMERAGYPKAQEHLSLHRDINVKTSQLIEQYRSGKLQLGIAVSQFLVQCLTEHVIAADKPMIDWVRAHSEARKQSTKMLAISSPFAVESENGSAQGSQSRLRVDPVAVYQSVGQLLVAGDQKKT